MAVSGAVVMVGCAAACVSSSPVMWLCDGDGGVAVANADQCWSVAENSSCSRCCNGGAALVVAGPDIVVAVAVPELAVTVVLLSVTPARKLNTMAPVHLKPRHKRNSMASGNDRGQKRCL
ncbi:hypothetical protein DEO72_LG9g622 [Vigna unguiculata]|uniref:Secreted protein n=1 Tax=Vigna unguiculata TaxID=3917 RepID=A0A4D6MX29_VIGUN|nr:hypothetical protein DEO72_LG9g622 [Vigna unguiculata]